MVIVRKLIQYSGLLAFLIPIVLLHISSRIKSNRNQKIFYFIVFGLYITCILLFTLIRKPSTIRTYNLKPFWTYMYIRDPQFRREIMGNIYLFIPFGFILSMITGTGIVITSLFGFIFSTMIEFLQYYFCLGMSEFDDVFHNTLGTVIGYIYWKLLMIIRVHYGQQIGNAINKSNKWITRYVGRIIDYLANKKEK